MGQADRSLRVLYELRALDALGFRPEFEQCVRCGRDPDADSEVSGEARFLVSEGGVLCGSCQRPQDAAIPLQRGTRRALSRALQLPIAALHRLALTGPMLEEADRVVRHFQRFHLGVELRSQGFADRLA